MEITEQTTPWYDLPDGVERELARLAAVAARPPVCSHEEMVAINARLGFRDDVDDIMGDDQ